MNNERQKLEAMFEKYKKSTPVVIPRWTTNPDITFIDIDTQILKKGFIIYEAPFDDVWQGIHDPSIYDANTIWSVVKHDKHKIAGVIEHWENNKPLNPPYFVKHGTKDLALVADGKHRLTVAKYMGCERFPFIVGVDAVEWVKKAIPSAVELSRSS